MADRAEVIAWLEANGRSYKRAAKHFGIDYDQEARGTGSVVEASRARAPEVPAPAPVSAAPGTYLEVLERLLAKVQKDIDGYRGNDKATTALVSSRRLERDLEADIHAERERQRRAGVADDSEMTPDELAAALVDLVAQAPEPVIDAVEAAIHARRNPIRLVRA